MEYVKTNRGYSVLRFEDHGENECSIQESSLVEPAIWIGIDNPKPKLFLPDVDTEKKGWIDYPFPDCVHIFGRMELTQNQVKEILPYLQYFAEHGEMPNQEKGE